MELCLVGTCDGRHTCMTQESALQWWKVTSPRSLVQRPNLDAIVELHDWPETGSDDEDGAGSLAQRRGRRRPAARFVLVLPFEQRRRPRRKRRIGRV